MVPETAYLTYFHVSLLDVVRSPETVTSELSLDTRVTRVLYFIDGMARSFLKDSKYIHPLPCC